MLDSIDRKIEQRHALQTLAESRHYKKTMIAVVYNRAVVVYWCQRYPLYFSFYKIPEDAIEEYEPRRSQAESIRVQDESASSKPSFDPGHIEEVLKVLS